MKERVAHSIDARIRKQQSILICSGLGVILFGVWSIVRFILMRFMDVPFFDDLYELAIDANLTREVFDIVFNAVVAFVLVLDLLVRLYIGLSAIKEGRGKYKKTIIYVLISALYCATAIANDISAIVQYILGEYTSAYLSSAVVDITINIAMIEIVIAAIRVRKLEKVKNNNIQSKQIGN